MMAPLRAAALALVVAWPASTPRAGMIAVYAPAPADFEALRAAALTVAAGKPAPSGLTVRVSASCTLSAAFSVPEGASAYIRADGTLETLAGFEMRGESVWFESAAPEDDARAKAADAQGVTQMLPSSLRAARWRDAGVVVEFVLDGPARARAEVYAPDGALLASREWVEAGAGTFERAVPLDRVAGPVFVRWKSGDAEAVLRMNPASR